MKAILMSIQPKWCELIASGEKTIEVRKTAPKEVPFKVYMYCTAIKDKKYYTDEFDIPLETGKWKGNSHIVGEFVCDKVDCYPYGDVSFPIPAYDGDPTVCECGNGYYITCGELEKTCLEYKDLENYGKSKTLYGWHITDLKIYDEPKRLCDFNAICRKNKQKPDTECKGCPYAFIGTITETNEITCDRALMRPPQSWQYVEAI